MGLIKKPKQKEYYRLDNILAKDAMYNIPISERNIGKSYAVKERVLTRAYNSDAQFVYLRRFDRDVTASTVENYFGDMPISIITNGEYTGISTYRGAIFFCNFDVNGKSKRGKKIGHYIALNNDERTKSQAFPLVTDIIYEEFVTTKTYLPDEPTRLQNLVSTIFRERDGKVWLIGNKINRICPYFTEWQLTNIPRQKNGTIDVYNFTRYDADGDEIVTKIAVENCNSFNSQSKMFFGSAAKSITGGEWETKEYPHLQDKYENYERLYEVEFFDCGFTFILQLLMTKSGDLVIYCYPKTKATRNIQRKITTNFSENRLTTVNFNVNIRAEKMMKELLQQNKICFSDNLTGTDFNQVLLNRKGVL